MEKERVFVVFVNLYLVLLCNVSETKEKYYCFVNCYCFAVERKTNAGIQKWCHKRGELILVRVGDSRLMVAS